MFVVALTASRCSFLPLVVMSRMVDVVLQTVISLKMSALILALVRSLVPSFVRSWVRGGGGGGGGGRSVRFLPNGQARCCLCFLS